jgi:hypothetical protein
MTAVEKQKLDRTLYPKPPDMRQAGTQSLTEGEMEVGSLHPPPASDDSAGDEGDGAVHPKSAADRSEEEEQQQQQFLNEGKVPEMNKKMHH